MCIDVSNFQLCLCVKRCALTCVINTTHKLSLTKMFLPSYACVWQMSSQMDKPAQNRWYRICLHNCFHDLWSLHFPPILLWSSEISVEYPRNSTTINWKGLDSICFRYWAMLPHNFSHMCRIFKPKVITNTHWQIVLLLSLFLG